MIAVPLMERSRLEIKLGDYGVGSAAALTDPGLLPRVQEYRRRSGARMVPLDRTEIKSKIPTAEYHVSRKIDGEFTVLVYRGGEVLSVNPGGTVRVGLPWQVEAARLLGAAGVKEALLAGELYVADTGSRRPRVHDVTTVARQPQSADDLARLRFAVFDIISLDGAAPSERFDDVWQTIQRLFGTGQGIHPVEAQAAKDAAEVEAIFERWVAGEGAEGIVVRSDTAGMFKIKPRHTLDLVVLGFTESTEDREGLLHDMLLGIVRPDGTIQVVSRVGGGFSNEQRRAMLSDLKDMVVESEYAEVSDDHVAYQMVRPDWVVEISCLDLISQNTRGGPINRMVLDYSRDGSVQYHVVRRLPMLTIISPQFIRRREDKLARREDVRIEQVSEKVEIPLIDRDARQMKLPASEIIHREVYTKAAKGETMVRKFVVLKTNKETESDEYPGYVVHFTDFSPNRKTPLAREVRVSSSRDQIMQLCAALKEENVKKGWELHGGGGAMAATQTAEATATEEATPAKPAGKPKTRSKKKAAPADEAAGG
jgi:hypothetical protein